ncbi:MBL fold metallo-hydrolase [Paenibacillus lautus]|uniref:MBL fold metallo-hydrolase n=1 Tax=Paenibacillus lautus TaxID=1401 RepID=UPI003D2B890D
MKLQLIRNATLRIQYAHLELLVDPMFSNAKANPPVINTANDRRNPLVPLPFSMADKLRPNAVLVTHLHLDHWDQAAMDALPKTTPILCQPGDEDTLASQGFTSVTAVQETLEYEGVTIIRTGGHHGTGEIGQMMGQVSGFILKAEGQPTLYIAGDTIWCEPDMTVVNAGGARFLTGDPIIMDEDDVIELLRYAPHTKAVAVHMEAINHCLVTREGLSGRLAAEGLRAQMEIPQDGEWVEWKA